MTGTTGTMSRTRRLGLFLGPCLAIPILLSPLPGGMEPEAQRTAAVVVLMAVWWMFEAIPFAATALLPLALYPLLGVVPAGEVSRSYADANIFLFAGGFFVAMAMQKWNLHTRIALHILRRTGTRPHALVGGFMLATALLSMWISNTATALMMLPIALAVVDMFSREGKRGDGFAVCLLLGIAYAASIGGIATLVGTPPNVVLAQQYEKLPDARPIGFFPWMTVGLPVAAVMLLVAWILLTRILFRPGNRVIPEVGRMLEARLASLGPMGRPERTVLVIWGITVLAWIFRTDIDLGFGTLPGWARLFPEGFTHNGTVAIVGALLLFVTPVDWKRGEFALDWEWARRIPWGTLLLFGGGLAMADGMKRSGLVAWTGESLAFLQGMPLLLILLCITLFCTFLTELTSNVASANILLPILGGSLAPVLGVHPLVLMVPATMAVSCAFMLPVATPPNAIVFGSGRITIPRMARAGLLLNLVGVVLIPCITGFLLGRVFSLEPLP